MDSHHQHPASETGVLLIELQGNSRRNYTSKAHGSRDRDAKAELNRRSQACEFLAVTGIRVA